MTGHIYLITNKINNKKYVGLTKYSVEIRWKQHLKSSRKGAASPLYHSIRKYGEDKFSISLLEVVKIEELKEREIFYISLLETHVSFCKGYNQTIGGDGVIGHSGWHHTEKAKHAISKKNKNLKRTEACKKKISDAVKLKLSDPEIRKKISESSKNRIVSEKTRKKHAANWLHEKNPHFGKYGHAHPCGGPRSEAHSLMISESKKGWDPSKETRDRMSSSQKVAIVCLNDDMTFKKRYDCALDAVIDGFSYQQVGRAARGKIKDHHYKNFFWFKEEEYFT